jgi:hypothetical protein
VSQSELIARGQSCWLQATNFVKAQLRWQTRPSQAWRRIFSVQAVDYQWSRRSRILAAIAITVRLAYSVPAWADMLYFADGHPSTGKVVRVTSELIELQPTSNGWHRLIEEPIPQVVHRTELINRHDVLEVRGHKPYTGEVIYMDSFAVEMHTQEGTVRIPRFKMRKLVLGSLPAGFSQNNLVNHPLPVPQDLNTPMQVATPNDASPSTSAGSALAKSVPALTGPPSLRIPMDTVPPEPGVEPVYYQKTTTTTTESGTIVPATGH